MPSGVPGETFVEVYDRTAMTPSWQQLTPAASAFALSDDVVAFTAASGAALCVYDANIGTEVSMGVAAIDFVV